jgi:Mrp family chromosome partitioning ATPase
LTLDAQAKSDQIEASRRAASDAGAIPEALQSPTIANLRAQYAEARKHYAEMAGELGPLHPSLRQMVKQVDDLRRTINEEVERFAQSAKNDLARARDFEASLSNALEMQKRQSVQMSQASVRLRELERDVEASRDVYQSFLKRSRETEEQEGLNTSSARIIGEATVPQRRMFPPGMSVLAMIGFMLGGLAATGWVVAAERLPADPAEPRPLKSETKAPAPSPKPQPETPSRPPVAVALIEKPLIARLQESDVVRTLGGILPIGGIPDMTRIGWPTLRAGFPLTTFLNAMREMREMLAKRSPADVPSVMVVIGAGASEDRAIATLNVALAAARDGARVLIMDADHATHALSSKVNGVGKSEASRASWLSIGTKASRAIKTANGISILPAIKASDAKASGAICKAIAQTRSAGGYDLVILDGPQTPWSVADRALLDAADGLVAVLPANLDINGCMEDIITALGGAKRKLIGVVLNELHPATAHRQRDKQYA